MEVQAPHSAFADKGAARGELVINRAEDGSRRRRCPFSACLWARPARSPRRPRFSRRSCRWAAAGAAQPGRPSARPARAPQRGGRSLTPRPPPAALPGPRAGRRPLRSPGPLDLQPGASRQRLRAWRRPRKRTGGKIKMLPTHQFPSLEEKKKEREGNPQKHKGNATTLQISLLPDGWSHTTSSFLGRSKEENWKRTQLQHFRKINGGGGGGRQEIEKHSIRIHK
ncbi:uncharacterized protein LOC134384197 [Cynocephalus volans]|uniref:uncharacterized protein LOC134384197 n=1 Tax=Cynocephalus volans TaxID=110931 RepID=UPI002FC99C91